MRSPSPPHPLLPGAHRCCDLTSFPQTLPHPEYLILQNLKIPRDRVKDDDNKDNSNSHLAPSFPPWKLISWPSPRHLKVKIERISSFDKHCTEAGGVDELFIRISSIFALLSKFPPLTWIFISWPPHLSHIAVNWSRQWNFFGHFFRHKYHYEQQMYDGGLHWCQR